MVFLKTGCIMLCGRMTFSVEGLRLFAVEKDYRLYGIGSLITFMQSQDSGIAVFSGQPAPWPSLPAQKVVFGQLSLQKILHEYRRKSR